MVTATDLNQSLQRTPDTRSGIGTTPRRTQNTLTHESGITAPRGFGTTGGDIGKADEQLKRRLDSSALQANMQIIHKSNVPSSDPFSDTEIPKLGGQTRSGSQTSFSAKGSITPNNADLSHI